MKHVLVYHEPGASCHGPVNSGIWHWGDEIVVGFTKGVFMPDRGKPPLSDPDQPQRNVQARSLDGGLTWAFETPANLGEGFSSKGLAEGDAPPPALPAGGFDFTHPDFGLRMNGHLLRPTYDRGRTWQGPYAMPDFGLQALTSRTAYLVNGTRDCHLFVSARDTSFTVQAKLDDRTACVRTTDGGQTFEFLGWVVPEDPAPRSVCPSTVRLANGTLVAALRRRRDVPREAPNERGDAFDRVCWIDVYASSDDGCTWCFLNKVADTETLHLHNGNPPSLVLLPDGRLVCVYGYRSPVWGLRARVSGDAGRTWGRELMLREDGRNFDIGYPRSILRRDGQIVTAYWFNTDEHCPRVTSAPPSGIRMSLPTNSRTQRRTMTAETMTKELLLTDLSVCQPAEALAREYRPGCWHLVDYETDDGIKGVMVYARPEVNAPEVRLPLPDGTYKVYLGVNYAKSELGDHLHHVLWSVYGNLEVKLSGDAGFHRVAAEQMLAVDVETTEHAVKFPVGKRRFRTIHETYWRTAELKDQALVFRPPVDPYNGPDLAGVANLSYVRLVPLTEAEAADQPRWQPRAETRKLAQVWCAGMLSGHLDGSSHLPPHFGRLVPARGGAGRQLGCGHGDFRSRARQLLLLPHPDRRCRHAGQHLAGRVG